MSCEFQLTATLEGLDKFLDQENTTYDENESTGSRNAFPDFKIAVSPTREIVVFAKKTWLLICNSKWDSSVDGVKIKYNPNWHGHVNCKQGEEITSILCLPFLYQGQSIQSWHDWTCIVVGFSSGCIRFYTEAMQEIACSTLQEEPISEIKCHFLKGKTQEQENNEVYILYKTVICILNGSLLHQNLRNRRYQLAKNVDSSETENYILLDYKKYSFVGQEEVTDACLVGQTLVPSVSNTFDHLVTASLVGGFNSNYRASPPQSSLIITSGRKPFLGFHYTLESPNSPVLTDVALAVASKIKNSVTATLPDWFGFGSKKSAHSDKPNEAIQDNGEKLNCRFGLCDLWRQGYSVIVSPDGVFSAVSDSLGRVILVDNTTGVAYRMWKGYRDAQCGFIQVQEEIRKWRRNKSNSSKAPPRDGLFIVIYAPKKGLIDIFATQHGQRVTSFKVTKYGRLLYIPRHVGSNNTSDPNFSQNQVIFISEEGLKEFSIPFHCSLEEHSNRMSKDLHVLKKIKMLLKLENNSGDSKVVQDIEKYAKELRTDEIKLQTIESMIMYKNTSLEAFKAVLKVFLNDLQNQDRGDPPFGRIAVFAKITLNLLLFYEFLLNLNDLPLSEETNDATTKENNSVSVVLKLPEKELDIMLKFIAQIQSIERSKKQTTRVAFDEKRSTKLGQYLSCFDFELFLNHLNKNDKSEEKKGGRMCYLNVKLSNKDSKHSYLGEILFKSILSSVSCLDQWRQHVEGCSFNPEDLVLSLLSYWCTKNFSDDYSSQIVSLVKILKVVYSLNDPEVVTVEYNTESSWWLRLRKFIASNSNTIRGLLAALCCRSVTIHVEQEKDLSSKQSCEKPPSKSIEGSNETTTFNNDWETISKDTCQWDILITQLQDVALLNAVLSLSFKTQNKSDTLPEIPFDFEYQCLTSIQAGGIGRISELVAKWMVQFGFDPEVFINKKDLEFQDGKEEERKKCDLVVEFDKVNEARKHDENLNMALDYLALLKSRFPYSLTSSSLLGNMSWEYVAHWFKLVNNINYLEAASRYLEAIPANRIKYGICYLFWSTYLKGNFETLARVINKLGKVTRLTTSQEMGLKSNQVPVFVRLISNYLKIMLHTGVDEKTIDFKVNREAIWQNASTGAASSLVYAALSQPMVNTDLVALHLQLSYCLLMVTGLNVRHSRVFTSLFDNMEQSDFTLMKNSQPSCHFHDIKLESSRKGFLQKVITAAVQTIEIIEYIPPVSPSNDDLFETVPSTQFKVEEYKKWLQLCFELAGMWAISLDDLRRHQICELYSNGFDRLAEEVISSVNETAVLASQLLLLVGKRLKYFIQDSSDWSKKVANLDPFISDWFQTLNTENFRGHSGSLDDIEVMMCYIIKWLPEEHFDHKLATAVIESISSLKTVNS